MKAMLLREITSLKQNQNPLSLEEMDEPKLNEGEVLLHVIRCGVCHTELDEIEGLILRKRKSLINSFQDFAVFSKINFRIQLT